MRQKISGYLASILVCVLLLSACSILQQTFQQDPVQADLDKYYTRYETAIRSSGTQFINRTIGEGQLRKIRDQGRLFYDDWTKTAADHKAKKMAENDPRLKKLQMDLVALEKNVAGGKGN